MLSSTSATTTTIAPLIMSSSIVAAYNKSVPYWQELLTCPARKHNFQTLDISKFTAKITPYDRHRQTKKEKKKKTQSLHRLAKLHSPSVFNCDSIHVHHRKKSKNCMFSRQRLMGSLSSRPKKSPRKPKGELPRKGPAMAHRHRPTKLRARRHVSSRYTLHTEARKKESQAIL